MFVVSGWAINLRQCLLKAINKKRKQKKRSRANINNLNKNGTTKMGNEKGKS